LCCLVAGISDEVDFEDALGVASFLVASGRAPAPAQWIDSIIDQAQADAMEGLF
jgi:hypothetical protein